MPELRAAQPTDAGRVGAILSAFIDGTDWMPRVHTRAEDISFAGTMIERGWVTLSRDARGTMGFLSRDGAEVHALYVAPEARGQGHGAALLHAAQTACESLALYTFQANTGAQRFYLRHGFVEVARSDGAGNDEGLPDIRYCWKRKP